MANVLITGGTGLIGKVLSQRLTEKGYSVSVLGRSIRKDSNITGYVWDVKKQTIDENALRSADYIVHLAGANIAEKRWTAERKQEIIDSRVRSAQLIFETLRLKNIPIQAFISASAIGYYGAVTSEKIATETDPPRPDFLGEVCRQWEESADLFEELGIRTVKIRTGIVLSKQGGSLEKMTLPAQLGIASPIGNGKQYFPWIHIDDLCEIYIKAIEDERMRGAYNAVAPEHINNKEFTKSLAAVMHKPFWAPNVPAFVLKLLFGEMAEIILNGSRVSPEKIEEAGYSFKFSNHRDALNDIIG